MKHKLKKLAIAVTLAMGASQANAALTTGNNGELFLAAWSPSLQRSYIRDLGVGMSNFLTTSTTVATSGSVAFNPTAPVPTSPGSVLASNYSLTFQADTLLKSYLGNGTTFASDVVWMIGAVDNVGAINTGALRYLSTSSTPNSLAVITSGLTNGNLQSFGNVAVYITGNNQLGTMTSLNGSATATPADSASYFPVLGAGQAWAGQANFQALSQVGQSVPFFYLTPSNTSTTSRVLATRYQTASGAAFAWTLNTDGSLSYAAVPIPAAAWLFGSGLIGLVGIARRRKMLAA